MDVHKYPTLKSLLETSQFRYPLINPFMKIKNTPTKRPLIMAAKSSLKQKVILRSFNRSIKKQ